MLVCKNVIVNGRRTSMRLDRETWMALNDICTREQITIHDLCSKIDDARQTAGLSSSVRLFVLTYFRTILKQYENGTNQLEPTFSTQTLLNALSN